MSNWKAYSGELANRPIQYPKEGLTESERGRSPSDFLDHHEAALRTEVANWLDSEQHLLSESIQDASRRVAESEQQVMELRLKFEHALSDESARSAALSEMAEHRAFLVQQTANRLSAERDLNKFRLSNCIHEEASYPDSMPWHFAVLAMLMILETAINAVFYEDDKGIIGGAMVAMGISIINMFTAMGCGYLYRYKNLAALEKRLLGWEAFLLFFVSTVFCNALFSAFRTEYQQVADRTNFPQVARAFRAAWTQATSLFQGNIEFNDHWSFLLFGVGVLLSCIALLKGYTLDDKFPGHGQKHRNYRKAVQLEAEAQTIARQQLKAMCHQRLVEIKALQNEPNLQIGMTRRIIMDLTDARQFAEQRVAAIRRDYSSALRTYRQRSSSARAVVPLGDDNNPGDQNIQIDYSAADRVMAQLQTAQQDLKQLLDSRKDAIQSRIKSLQSEMAETQIQFDSSFLANVLREAEAAVSRSTPGIREATP